MGIETIAGALGALGGALGGTAAGTGAAAGGTAAGLGAGTAAGLGAGTAAGLGTAAGTGAALGAGAAAPAAASAVPMLGAAAPALSPAVEAGVMAGGAGTGVMAPTAMTAGVEPILAGASGWGPTAGWPVGAAGAAEAGPTWLGSMANWMNENPAAIAAGQEVSQGVQGMLKRPPSQPLDLGGIPPTSPGMPLDIPDRLAMLRAFGVMG